jgi:PAS domain S-box-containing protein
MFELISAVPSRPHRGDRTSAGQEQGDMPGRNERLFRAVVESTPTGVLMVDRSGAVVLVNREVERLFGYERSELLGQPIEVLIPHRFREHHPDYRQSFYAQPQTRTMGAGRDLFGLRKDGAEFPVEIGLNPIETEEGLFVLASVVDISARRRIEARFRVAVESSPNGIVMVDRSGRIVLVNQETERLFGYGREELVGQPIEILVPDQIHDRHPALREAFSHSPERRAMGAGRDLFGRHKSGAEMPVEIGLNPIDTDEGLFVLATVVDISARKKAEADIRRSNEELERFAYVASHDLQEPLRTVASYVQLLERRYANQFDADGKEFLGYVVDGAKRMQRLISDLLALSRVGTRGAPLARVSADTVLDAAIANLQVTLAGAQAAITRGPLPDILADPVQLEQLFTNLIGNAVKFHGAQAPSVRVSAERQGAEWVFKVEDRGIGIDPQYFERIFVIFQRLHPREEYPGTGIGLAICKKIVERHGGRIWVESEPGHGTKFFFTLRPPTASS